MAAIDLKIREDSVMDCGTFAKYMKRLSELVPGQKAVIHSFENDEIFLKLMEMGCVPGEEVLMEMQAPLGDPISIKVAGYQLSLRLEEAQSIIVTTAKKI